jgi:hypothetical protein
MSKHYLRTNMRNIQNFEIQHLIQMKLKTSNNLSDYLIKNSRSAFLGLHFVPDDVQQ